MAVRIMVTDAAARVRDALACVADPRRLGPDGTPERAERYLRGARGLLVDALRHCADHDGIDVFGRAWPAATPAALLAL